LLSYSSATDSRMLAYLVISSNGFTTSPTYVSGTTPPAISGTPSVGIQHNVNLGSLKTFSIESVSVYPAGTFTASLYMFSATTPAVSLEMHQFIVR